MNNILVPIDGSAAALRAIALAVAELKCVPGGRLHLLNVQAPLLQPWPGKLVSPDQVQEELRRRGTEVLARARDMAGAVDVEPKLHVRVGSVAEEIVACANEHACDGIVMGTRGLGAAAAMALGSVAARVVHLARMPVTLVK